jgi:hypothetical protein
MADSGPLGGGGGGGGGGGYGPIYGVAPWCLDPCFLKIPTLSPSPPSPDPPITPHPTHPSPYLELKTQL